MAIDYISEIKTGMLIGLIDADLVDGGTRHPNLALMKIAGYCKSKKCTVELLESYDNTDDYELVYVSRVFTFTKVPDDIQGRSNVRCGGTGFFSDGGPNLPDEIEHHKPDYTLYTGYVERKIAEGRSRSWFADYLDYSIGFTTRGCFRRCSFCVNKKYRHAFRHSPVSEFLDENRPYIYLWDDNFFAYPRWESVLDELVATGKPFQFRQGLDIRLMDEHKAKRLSNVRYVGDFIFAFDHIEDRDLIESKLEIWRSYTVRGTRLYVLCGYQSRDEKDIENTFERIRILMHYGCLPYIMRYEGEGDDSYHQSRWARLYVNIARWCNQPQFFKKLSFRQFCEKNQIYHKNKNTKCSALQSMEEFEAEFPDIAKRYFDLRYEEVNMLMRYGRQFFGKPANDVSEVQKRYWGQLRAGELSHEEILLRYYDKDLDIVWAKLFSDEDYSREALAVFETVRTASLEEIYGILCSSDHTEALTPENIPQYSSIDDVYRCANIMRFFGEDELLTFDAMGIYLDPEKKKSDVANKKYGENHGKTAALLDLAYLEKALGKTGFRRTYFDTPFDSLDDDEKEEMAARLALRIPIIRKMLVDARYEEVVMGDYLVTLSMSTKKRRRPNVNKLLDMIAAHTERGSDISDAILNVRREL